MVKLMRPEDAVRADKLAIGIYGDNGMGKTRFVSTIDPTIPTLVVSGSEEPLLKPLGGKSHIWSVSIQTWAELGEVYNLASTPGAPPALLEMLKDSTEKDPGRKEVIQARIKDPRFRSKVEPFFGCIAIDTWTRLQALALAAITGQEPPEEGTEAEFISEAPRLPKGFDAWQKIGSLTAEWMRYFVRLPIHKVFLFQEQDRHPKFEGDGEVVTLPALTPAAIPTAKEILELLGRLYVVLEGGESAVLGDKQPKIVNLEPKEVRYLFIGKDGRYFAKGDTEAFGVRAIRDPDWGKIASVMLSTNEREG